MTPYILVVVGLILVWLEFYLPGGALAMAAAFFVLAGLVVFFSQTQSMALAILFFLLTAVAVIFVVWLAIYRIKKSADRDSFFLSKDQEGYKAADMSQELIGKHGVTLTECGPSGYALIDNKRYPIVCRGPYLAKGVQVEVIAKEIGHLIVKPLR